MEEQNQTNQNLEQEQQVQQEYNPVPHEEIVESKNNLKLIIGSIVLFLILVGGGIYWWSQNTKVVDVFVGEPNVNQGQRTVTDSKNASQNIVKDSDNKVQGDKYKDNDIHKLAFSPEELLSYGIYNITRDDYKSTNPTVADRIYDNNKLPKPVYKYGSIYWRKMSTENNTSELSMNFTVSNGTDFRGDSITSIESVKKDYNESIKLDEFFIVSESTTVTTSTLKGVGESNIHTFYDIKIDDEEYLSSNFRVLDSNAYFYIDFLLPKGTSKENIENLYYDWSKKLEQYPDIDADREEIPYF